MTTLLVTTPPWHAFLGLTLLVASACGVGELDSTDPVDDPERKPFSALPELKVFILAGQSNMVGRGFNDELTGIEASTVAGARIYFNFSTHNNTNTKKWLKLGPGFGASESRFGPELGFGHRLRALCPQDHLAVIKVAEGATSLAQDWTATTGRLYELLLSEVRIQLNHLQAHWQPQLVGLMWMQGESDSMSYANAIAYKGRLTTFITSLRRDLGAPALPVVAGLVAPHQNVPYSEYVRAATKELVSKLPPMKVVETADLPRHANDIYHYTSYGNLMLGRRFAHAAAAMATTTTSSHRPVGKFDGFFWSAASGWLASGWACDRDAPSKSIVVHFYLNGPYGSGTFAGHTTANKTHEPTVTAACGGGTAHRFAYAIPGALTGKKVYIYGIDATDNPNTLLGGSPKTVP